VITHLSSWPRQPTTVKMFLALLDRAESIASTACMVAILRKSWQGKTQEYCPSTQIKATKCFMLHKALVLLYDMNSHAAAADNFHQSLLSTVHNAAAPFFQRFTSGVSAASTITLKFCPSSMSSERPGTTSTASMPATMLFKGTYRASITSV